jgi:hypothetical protein
LFLYLPQLWSTVSSPFIQTRKQKQQACSCFACLLVWFSPFFVLNFFFMSSPWITLFQHLLKLFKANFTLLLRNFFFTLINLAITREDKKRELLKTFEELGEKSFHLCWRNKSFIIGHSVKKTWKFKGLKKVEGIYLVRIYASYSVRW